jgi:hypothetical protein
MMPTDTAKAGTPSANQARFKIHRHALPQLEPARNGQHQHVAVGLGGHFFFLAPFS